jgi:hypothetical protein
MLIRILYILFSILVFIQSARAAFEFEGAQEKIPSFSRELNEILESSQLLDEAELNEKLKRFDIQTRWIPNTLWDLFMLRADVLKTPEIQVKVYRDGAPVDPKEAIRRSRELRKYIESKGLTEFYKNADYAPLIRELLADLSKFHFADPIDEYTDKIRILAMNRLPVFKPIEDFLIASTQLEVEAYKKGQLPLFRFTRKTKKVEIASQTLNLMDVHPQKTRLGFVSYLRADYSFSYSPLAAVVGDGSVTTVFDLRTFSACTFSYFIGDLRDRLFEVGQLPFRPDLPSFLVESKRREFTVLPDSVVYAVFLDRKNLKTESESWYLPNEFPNDEAGYKGEDFHPRLKLPVEDTHVTSQAVLSSAAYDTEEANEKSAEQLLTFVRAAAQGRVLSINGKTVSAGESAQQDQIQRWKAGYSALIPFLEDHESRVRILEQLSY